MNFIVSMNFIERPARTCAAEPEPEPPTESRSSRVKKSWRSSAWPLITSRERIKQIGDIQQRSAMPRSTELELGKLGLSGCFADRNLTCSAVF